jgi:hypothetical protein
MFCERIARPLGVTDGLAEGNVFAVLSVLTRRIDILVVVRRFV